MNLELTWIDLKFELGEPARISLDIKIKDTNDTIHCRNLTGDIWIDARHKEDKLEPI